MATKNIIYYSSQSHWSANYAFVSKERDTETGLSVTSLRSVSSLPLGHFRTSSNGTRWLRRFGARYYFSDLSIWLSVDPMVDKYPSLSPYVYCANNPVKLVDPNGMQWETAEDNSTANNLITSAEKKIESNNKLIKSASENLKKQKMSQKDYDDYVNDLKGQNKLLEEGIEGIKKMGDDSQIFHFNIDDNRTHHNVNVVNKNGKQVVNINVNGMKNIQWHECIHVIDYLNEPTKHGFDNAGYLGSIDGALAETHAYRSEWSFHHDKERFSNINRLYDINDSFILKRKSLDRQ